MSLNVEHNKLAQSLGWLPQEFGGTQNMDIARIKSVNTWMDHFVRPVSEGGMLGYTLRKDGPFQGHKIYPGTHRQIGHDPLLVAKVYSGNGGHSHEAYVLADIHRSIDGIKVTEKFDRNLAQYALPGIETMAKYGIMQAIGKGISIGCTEFHKAGIGEIKYEQAVLNTAKGAGIEGSKAILKLTAAASIHKAAMNSRNEILLKVSENQGAFILGSLLVDLTVDAIKLANGKITQQEMIFNAASSTISPVAAIYTSKIGALLGTLILPGLGTVAGAFIGGIVGSVLVSSSFDLIKNDLSITEDMFRKELSWTDILMIDNAIKYDIQFSNFMVSFEGLKENNSMLTEIDRSLDQKLMNLLAETKKSLL